MIDGLSDGDADRTEKRQAQIDALLQSGSWEKRLDAARAQRERVLAQKLKDAHLQATARRDRVKADAPPPATLPAPAVTAPMPPTGLVPRPELPADTRRAERPIALIASILVGVAVGVGISASGFAARKAAPPAVVAEAPAPTARLRDRPLPATVPRLPQTVVSGLPPAPDAEAAATPPLAIPRLAASGAGSAKPDAPLGEVGWAAPPIPPAPAAVIATRVPSPPFAGPSLPVAARDLAPSPAPRIDRPPGPAPAPDRMPVIAPRLIDLASVLPPRISLTAPKAFSAPQLTQIGRLLESEGMMPEVRTSRFALAADDVRFFHAADAGLARGIAAAIGATARDFSRFAPLPQPGTIEIRLGTAH